MITVRGIHSLKLFSQNTCQATLWAVGVFTTKEHSNLTHIGENNIDAEKNKEIFDLIYNLRTDSCTPRGSRCGVFDRKRNEYQTL